MMRVSIVWTRLAQALVVALVAVNVYRAATSSITIDEAFTYNQFVSPPLRDALKVYDANNHVLHTLLCRFSVSLWGPSEFSLRLPSLLGGVLYFWVALRISQLVLGGGPMLLISAALAGLNPMVLDYLSMARGYSLGMAFWLLAMWQMLRLLPEPAPRSFWKPGVALGLAAAANLVFILPGAALAGAFIVAVLVHGGQARALVERFAIPGIVTAFLILVLPLSRAEPGSFYLGTESLWRALDTLTQGSLYRDAPMLTLLIPGWGELSWWLAHWMNFAVAGLLVAAGCMATLSGARRLRARSLAALDSRELFLVFSTGGAYLTLVLLMTAHHVFRMPYPYGRTGLYWIPWLTLLGMTMWHRIDRPRGARWVAALPAAMVLALYIGTWNIAFYADARTDAGTKRIVNVLRGMERGDKRIHISASWQLEAGLNFYRQVYHMSWLEPIGRTPPDQPADYHVLLPQDAAVIEKLKLKPIYRDPVSEAVLGIDYYNDYGRNKESQWKDRGRDSYSVTSASAFGIQPAPMPAARRREDGDRLAHRLW